MVDKVSKIRLEDGTVVRHKSAGYQGLIEGTTEIKTCFTRGGAHLVMPTTKELFQYRVVVAGEPMRHIAPSEDLEILEETAAVVCFRCQTSFRSKPGIVGKAGGHCLCGGLICPSCLACQAEDVVSAKGKKTGCLQQRKRFVRKLANEKKARSA
jgi:hypothetical protein